jgi:hypothetical protein
MHLQKNLSVLRTAAAAAVLFVVRRFPAPMHRAESLPAGGRGGKGWKVSGKGSADKLHGLSYKFFIIKRIWDWDWDWGQKDLHSFPVVGGTIRKLYHPEYGVQVKGGCSGIEICGDQPGMSCLFN